MANNGSKPIEPTPQNSAAAAPPASGPLPTEITVTFPLLNLKATTSLLPSNPTFTTEPNIKQDREVVIPPPSYYFDPRTQPFYYPSTAVKQEQLKDLPQIQRFALVEQPSTRQRKSYKNENRYIVPNPLSVAAKSVPFDYPNILRGMVTAKLVDEDGNLISSDKGNILESVDGSLSQLFCAPSLSADFSLKVLQTSQGTMYRLLFIVSYVTESFGNCEEKIYSRPFMVHSNRRKNSKEKPIVQMLKPLMGPTHGNTEVWIKGVGFCDKVVVMFGDKEAKVVENNENLVVVLAPPVEDEDKTVTVTISNCYQKDLRTADRVLRYTYRSTKFEGMDMEEAIPSLDMFRDEFLHDNLSNNYL